MTTIACKDGIVAGDTRVTESSGSIAHNKMRKVRLLKDGSVLAFAGGTEDFEQLYKAMWKGHALPKLEDINALMLKPDGSVWLYEGNLWVKQPKLPHRALGSGMDFALGAMDAGATAVDAVRIAIKRDPSSGGRVQWSKAKKVSK